MDVQPPACRAKLALATTQIRPSPLTKNRVRNASVGVEKRCVAIKNGGSAAAAVDTLKHIAHRRRKDVTTVSRC